MTIFASSSEAFGEGRQYLHTDPKENVFSEASAKEKRSLGPTWI